MTRPVHKVPSLQSTMPTTLAQAPQDHIEVPFSEKDLDMHVADG